MNSLEQDILSLLHNGNTSYKYFYLLGCLDLIKNDKFEYTFNELSKYMISEALIHGDFADCRFTKNDRLFDLVTYLSNLDAKFLLSNSISDIIKLLDKYEIEDVYVSKKIKELVLYVPYRLIVNDEIKNIISNKKDASKNKIIEEASKNIETIYIIDNHKIIWRDKYYNFILLNRGLLKQKVIETINHKFRKE